MYSRYLLASSFVLALAAMGAGCSSDKPPEEPASKADANPPQVSASTEQVDATAAGAPGNHESLMRQRGMFSLLPLGEERVARLRDEYAVYVVGKGRVNVAGLTASNLEPVCRAIAAVTSRCRRCPASIQASRPLVSRRINARP